MNISKQAITVLLILTISIAVKASEPLKVKFYGFVRNEIFFNSRENIQAFDGLLNIMPKPEKIVNGIDENLTPQMELLSVATRIGVDLSGSEIFGAKASAKIEGDFAGTGNTYFLFRIRQANIKLNWSNTELLIGQTWHPLFGNVFPSHNSLNAGAPFQPFNRSPQIRLNQKFGSSFSLTGTALYQMQFLSQGPAGASSIYLKHAMLPNLNLTAEYRTKHWLSGAGVDFKIIHPRFNESLSSTSFVAFTQFSDKKIQLKAKAILGQNLTDHIMIGGYGVTENLGGISKYTNINTFTSWVNAEYGKTWQVGIFAGISKNLGSRKPLMQTFLENNVTIYGNGFYNDEQLITDQLWRIVPNLNYNFSNIRVALEYELTNAVFGKVQSNGKATNPYNINNHRIMALISYNF